MIRAAAAAGHLEEERAALESLTAIKRAGAGTIITYWAKDAASGSSGKGKVEAMSELWRRATRAIPGGVNSPVRAMKGVGLDEPVFIARGNGAYVEDVAGNRTSTGCSRGGRSSSGTPTPRRLPQSRLPPRHDVRCADRGRGPARRGDHRRGAVDRDGADGQLGHRGVDERRPARPCRTATRPGYQVRRLLPRSRRRAAGECRLGDHDARDPVDPGDPDRGSTTRSSADSTMSTASRRRASATAKGWPRFSSSRSQGTWAASRRHRVSSRRSSPCGRDRCAARLRRGDDRASASRRGGAQERFGVSPDLTVLGKIVGGGLPAAAFGGRAELMERLAPVGDVYQAGTLSGNPLATAAGISVLRRLRDPAVYEELEATAARLEEGLASFGQVQRVGGMLTLFCGDGPIETTRMRPLRHRAVRRALPSPARRGHLPATVSVRVPLPSSRTPTTRSTRRSAAARRSSNDDRGRDVVHGDRGGVRAESVLWERRSARPSEQPERRLLAPRPRRPLALGLETIYEGYLLHYGRSRLFAPSDGHRAPPRRRAPRPRARACRCTGTSRRRGPRRSPLPLRPGPGRGSSRRRRGLGGDRRAPRSGWSRRGVGRCGSGRRGAARRPRARGGDAAVDAALAAHARPAAIASPPMLQRSGPGRRRRGGDERRPLDARGRAHLPRGDRAR